MTKDEGTSASPLIITVKTPPEKDCCGNCLFWGGDKEKQNGGQGTQGPCREDSPTVFMVMVPQGPLPAMIANPSGQKQQQIAPAFTSAWPMVSGDRWCGKHKRLEGEGAKPEGEG